MENASKALLIAAAILVVIILIAFGMNVLRSTGDVGDQATSTGQALNQQTTAASKNAIEAIQGSAGWFGN